MKGCTFSAFCILLLFKTGFLFSKNESGLKSSIGQLTDTVVVNENNFKAELSFKDSKYDSSYFYALKALIKSRELHFIQGEARASYILAKYYKYKNLFSKSITLLISSEALFERIGDNNGVTNSYLQLGLINYDEKKFARADSFFQKDLTLLSEKSNPQKYALLKYLSGLSLIETGDYKNGERYLLEARALNKSLNNQNGYIETQNGLADLYYRTGKLDSARKYYEESFNYYSSKKDNEGISVCFLGLGNICIKENETDKSIDYFDNAYSLSRQSNFFLVAEKAARKLSEIYMSKSDFKNAYKYQTEYYQIRDSIQSVENIKATATLQSELEVSRKQSQIDLLNKEHEIDRRTRFMLISIGGLLLIFSLIIFYRFRQERKTKELIRVEKQRSETLLLNILPEETAQELKENGKALAHAYEEVSVLFADVQGFTKISENLSAEVLVQLLDRYFSAFDEIIVHFGLEKIKTIGDAYMCAGGLPIPDKSFVEMTVNAALEMQKYVEKTKVESLEKQEPYFEMRIGIHTGPVVSGVVGTKKFAYDIWGDTVNTAARIQQNSEPGKVNISRATYNLIEGKFNCTFRGRIGAKNKGDIEMYFVDYIG